MLKIIGAIASVAVLISGCSNSKDIAPTIICVIAPIGGVTPDDVYVSKFGQPVVVRCPPNMVPKVVVTGGSVKADPPRAPTSAGTPVNPTTPETQNPNVELSQANPGGATAAMSTATGMQGARAGHGDGAVAVEGGRTLRSDSAGDIVGQIFGEFVN